MSKSIGENIRKLRRELNLTQQEFAERIGTVQNTVTGYETSRRNPSNQVITLICREFNVNRNYLLTGEGPMFVEMNNEEKLADFFGKITVSDDDDAIKKFMTMLADMKDEDLQKTREFLELFMGRQP